MINTQTETRDTSNLHNKWMHILGSYTSDEEKLTKLLQRWHSKDLTIVCAIDGGLKGGIGTSSYAFFWPDDAELLISGSAMEYQPHKSTPSTRQELLGQLAVEC